MGSETAIENHKYTGLSMCTNLKQLYLNECDEFVERSLTCHETWVGQNSNGKVQSTSILLHLSEKSLPEYQLVQ